MPAARNLAPLITQRQAHHCRRRCLCLGQAVSPQHMHAHIIHRQIDHDYAEDAEHQSAGQVLARFADLAGHETRGLPSTISKLGRNQRRAKGYQGLQVVAEAPDRLVAPGEAGPLTVRPMTTNAPIATSFKTMNTFCVTLPARTPMQLMIVSKARATEPSIAARNRWWRCRTIRKVVRED